jgi:type VI secretion system protein
MPLSLQILTYKGMPFNRNEKVVFDKSGGTIGRSNENTLALPDPDKFVSRRHATITFENGQYILTDSSLSGTFVNTQVEPIGQVPLVLANDMRIRIGEYEILVSITSGSDQFASGLDGFSPFGESASASFPEHSLSNSWSGSEGSADIFGQTDNPFNPLLDQQPSFHSNQDNYSSPFDSRQPNFNSLMDEPVAAIHDSFVPAAPVPLAKSATTNEIPDDFNFEDLFNTQPDDKGESLSSEAKAPAAAVISPADFDTFPQAEWSPDVKPAPVVRPQNPKPETAAILGSVSIRPVEVPAHPLESTPTDSELFTAFIKGAGLENKSLKTENPFEKMRLIGLMFRHLVEGAVAILRSRTEFKSQFRVSITTIKTVDNNPLKFSVTADEAACHLLENGQGGFKASIEAIDEGFNDIVSHQLAMQAGIQAALAEVFSKFNPQLIEKQFEEGLVLQKKSKCWDKFVKSYPEMVEQMTEDFYGETFAEAYEKQMKRLSVSRSNK